MIVLVATLQAHAGVAHTACRSSSYRLIVCMQEWLIIMRDMQEWLVYYSLHAGVAHIRSMQEWLMSTPCRSGS